MEDFGDEGYPWGKDPWPGTENLDKAVQNHPAAKDGFWFDEEHFKKVMLMLNQRLSEIAPDDGSVKKLLTDAALQQKDLGQWSAAGTLFSSTKQANDLMVQAYDNFVKAYNAVIDRLKQTSKTNTGVEIKNYDTVTYSNVQTIDPSTKANSTTDPTQTGNYS